MSIDLRWGLVAAGALVAGCGRKAEGPAPPATRADLPTSPRGPAGVAVAQGPSIVIAESADMNSTLQKLTSALRDYVVSTRRVPKDFDEFAAKSLASFPQPPAGKKYAIKGQEVVLANR